MQVEYESILTQKNYPNTNTAIYSINNLSMIVLIYKSFLHKRHDMPITGDMA